jgi:hypothetical protein
MDIIGVMIEYLIVNFATIGEDGVMISIGKDMKAGVLETINLNQNNKCSNKDSRDNSSINRDLRFNNINNGDNSNRDNPRFRNLKVNNKENHRLDNHNSNKDNHRFSNLRDSSSHHNNISLKCSNPNNRVPNLRASNAKGNRNTHSLKKNLKEEVKDIGSRMARGLKTLPSIISVG